jgi:hypothetical protein
MEPNVCNEPQTTTNPFAFIKTPNKLKGLINANKILNLDRSNKKFLIFIYSAIKVGSTSLVSSLRTFMEIYAILFTSTTKQP